MDPTNTRPNTPHLFWGGLCLAAYARTSTHILITHTLLLAHKHSRARDAITTPHDCKVHPPNIYGGVYTSISPFAISSRVIQQAATRSVESQGRTIIESTARSHFALVIAIANCNSVLVMVDERALPREAASYRTGTMHTVQDRWASYHPKTGALRCIACSYAVITHERLWPAHTLTRSHRENVRKWDTQEVGTMNDRIGISKTHQADEAGPMEKTHPKSIPVGDAGAEHLAVSEALESSESSTLKRKDSDTQTSQSKRARQDTHNFDDEWAEFQRTVLAPSKESAQASTYEYAIISAEPELHPDESVALKEPDNTDARHQRARMEQIAREEILARIEEEQRAQEEANERYAFIYLHFRRVRSLRARFARIKQIRHPPRIESRSPKHG